MKKLLIILCILIPAFVFGQKKYNILYIGSPLLIQVHDSIKAKGNVFITTDSKYKIKKVNESFYFLADSTIKYSDTITITIIVQQKGIPNFTENRNYIIIYSPIPSSTFGKFTIDYLERTKNDKFMITKAEFIQQDSLWIECGIKGFPFYDIFTVHNYTCEIISNIKTVKISVPGNKVSELIKLSIRNAPIGTMIVFSVMVYNKENKRINSNNPIVLNIKD